MSLASLPPHHCPGLQRRLSFYLRIISPDFVVKKIVLFHLCLSCGFYLSAIFVIYKRLDVKKKASAAFLRIFALKTYRLSSVPLKNVVFEIKILTCCKKITRYLIFDWNLKLKQLIAIFVLEVLIKHLLDNFSILTFYFRILTFLLINWLYVIYKL